MKVIFLLEVKNLGKKGDVREVAAGYARNFLLPKKIAILATNRVIRMMELEKKKEKNKRKEKTENFKELLKSSKEITIKSKANAQGHLFAGIGAKEISQALSQAIKTKVDPGAVKLDKKIKEVGEYVVEVRAGSDVVKLKTKVESE